MRRSQRALAVAAVLVVLAFLLRVFRIGEQELWIDEAFSFHMATLPSGLWKALRIENSPPLYYLFLRGWVPFAGITESAMRLPSAFFGALGVVAAITAGWRLFNARVGLWAGAVMALSPIHIYYSQEARGYAFLTFALIVTYMLLVRALEQPSRGRWVLTGLAALVSVYTHYGAFIGLLPTLLFLWKWPSPHPLRARAPGYAQAFLLLSACILPWVIWCFSLMSHPFAVGNYLTREWERTPPALAIPKTLEIQTIGHHADIYPNLTKIYPSLQYPTNLRLLGLSLFLFLAVWAIIPWRDDHLGVPDVGKRKALLWAWLVVPLVVLWLVSLYRPLYLLGRYDLIAFPAMPILVGFALAKIQAQPRTGRLLAALAGLLILCLVGFKLSLYYQLATSYSPMPSPRATTRALASRVRTGDVAAFNNIQAATILYYLYRLGYRWEERECRNSSTGERFVCRIFPPEDEVAYGLPEDSLQPSSFARQLRFSLKGPDNVLWVVAELEYITEAVFFQEAVKLDVEVTSFHDPGTVPLYQLRPR